MQDRHDRQPDDIQPVDAEIVEEPSSAALTSHNQERSALGPSGSWNAATPQPAADQPRIDQQPVNQQRLGHPVIAWIVVAAISSMIVSRVFFAGEAEEAEMPVTERLQERVAEWQGKYLVGASRFPTITGEKLFEEAQALDTGSIRNRLRYVVIAGELVGPEKGAAHLEDLRRRIRQSPTEPTPSDTAIMETLETLYEDFQREAWDAPSIAPAQREWLTSQLGWFGRLALHPAESSDAETREAVVTEAVWVVPGVVVLAMLTLLMALLALAGCALFFVLILQRRLASRLAPWSPFGGIYVEAFAIWLVLHVGAGILLVLLRVSWPNLAIWERWQIGLIAAGMTASAVAMFWPLLRGVSWRQIRHDIGLNRGRNLLWEALLGVAGWLSTLPILALVLVGTLILAAGLAPRTAEPADPFAPQQMPAHPIVQWVAEAGWGSRLLIVLIAAVLAPVIEEIMFRGFLYRHLREATWGWRVTSSVVFSTLLSSFIFAAIHPQGLIAIPALSTLAAAFCLLREWRGSLVAPIAAHAANNGLLTIMLLSLLS